MASYEKSGQVAHGRGHTVSAAPNGHTTCCGTDRKFAVKARLYQALGVTLAVVRSYLHSPKVLQSLISVLKLYATDG